MTPARMSEAQARAIVRLGSFPIGVKSWAAGFLVSLYHLRRTRTPLSPSQARWLGKLLNEWRAWERRRARAKAIASECARHRRSDPAAGFRRARPRQGITWVQRRWIARLDALQFAAYEQAYATPILAAEADRVLARRLAWLANEPCAWITAREARGLARLIVQFREWLTPEGQARRHAMLAEHFAKHQASAAIEYKPTPARLRFGAPARLLDRYET